MSRPLKSPKSRFPGHDYEFSSDAAAWPFLHYSWKVLATSLFGVLDTLLELSTLDVYFTSKYCRRYQLVLEATRDAKIENSFN